jgi:hypothetical protein
MFQIFKFEPSINPFLDLRIDFLVSDFDDFQITLFSLCRVAYKHFIFHFSTKSVASRISARGGKWAWP